jgi:hypothetical protein
MKNTFLFSLSFVALLSTAKAHAVLSCSNSAPEAQIIGVVSETKESTDANSCLFQVSVEKVWPSLLCPLSDPITGTWITAKAQSNGCPVKGMGISGIVVKTTSGNLELDGSWNTAN